MVGLKVPIEADFPDRYAVGGADDKAGVAANALLRVNVIEEGFGWRL